MILSRLAAGRRQEMLAMADESRRAREARDAGSAASGFSGTARSGRRRQDMKVRDVMTRDFPQVAPDTPLKDVAQSLVERRIPAAPVVDAHGRVVGVVAESDLVLREFPGSGGRRLRRGRRGRRPDGGRAGTSTPSRAGEAMTGPAESIDPQAPVADAARLLMRPATEILPVVDEAQDGKLVGIVTRSDLVRPATRPDREVAEDVERLIRRFWIRFESLEVSVSRGEVLLRGTVTERAEADLAARAAGSVPGVFAVESQLGWRRGSAA
jgi:CBS domain-containing protein